MKRLVRGHRWKAVEEHLGGLPATPGAPWSYGKTFQNGLLRRFEETGEVAAHYSRQSFGASR